MDQDPWSKLQDPGGESWQVSGPDESQNIAFIIEDNCACFVNQLNFKGIRLILHKDWLEEIFLFEI